MRCEATEFAAAATNQNEVGRSVLSGRSMVYWVAARRTHRYLLKMK